jgi:hypothetical protein
MPGRALILVVLVIVAFGSGFADVSLARQQRARAFFLPSSGITGSYSDSNEINAFRGLARHAGLEATLKVQERPARSIADLTHDGLTIHEWLKDHRNVALMALITHSNNGSVCIEHFEKLKFAEDRERELLEGEFGANELTVISVPSGPGQPPWHAIALTGEGLKKNLPRLRRDSVFVLGWCQSHAAVAAYKDRGAAWTFYSAADTLHKWEVTDLMHAMARVCPQGRGSLESCDYVNLATHKDSSFFVYGPPR